MPARAPLSARPGSLCCRAEARPGGEALQLVLRGLPIAPQKGHFFIIALTGGATAKICARAGSDPDHAIAGGGRTIGLAGIVPVALMLALKQTEAFLAITDKDTGVAGRAVSVEKAGMEQAEAIRQSLLYAYVTGRETYDQQDNEPRILCTCTRNESAARQSLVALGPRATRPIRRRPAGRAPG